MFQVISTTNTEDEVIAMALITVEDTTATEDGLTTITGWVYPDWSDAVVKAALTNAACIGYAENGDVLPECECLTCITEGGYDQWGYGRKGGYTVTATIPAHEPISTGQRLMLSGLFVVTDGESVADHRTITNYEWSMEQDVTEWTDYHCTTVHEWAAC